MTALANLALVVPYSWPVAHHSFKVHSCIASSNISVCMERFSLCVCRSVVCQSVWMKTKLVRTRLAHFWLSPDLVSQRRLCVCAVFHRFSFCQKKPPSLFFSFIAYFIKPNRTPLSSILLCNEVSRFVRK